MKRPFVIGSILILTVGTWAPAATTIDTTPWDSTVFPLGEPTTATYGQTITAPLHDNVLTSFFFFLDDSPIRPGFTAFEAFVYAWDGIKATGPALFTSPPMSTTNNAGNDGFETFKIDTGKLSLEPGRTYVLFFTTANLFDGVEDASLAALRTDNPYPGGEFFYLGNGSDFSAVTREPWVAISSPIYDLGFRATFVVPEPPSAIMLYLLFATATAVTAGRSSICRLTRRWS